MSEPAGDQGGVNPGAAGRLEAWVVTDGRAGIENQALGLAEALAARLPLHLVVKRIVVAEPFRGLPRFLWGDPFARLSGEGALLRPPYPDLWIGCGRLSVPLTMAMRARSPKTFTVQLQNPRAPLSAFGVVVAPGHDRLAGANVIETLGAPGRVVAARIAADAGRLAPAVPAGDGPVAAVLIGGPNRVYRFSGAYQKALASLLAALAASPARLMVTTSRRTPPQARAMIADALGAAPHFLWDGKPVLGLDNPYFGMLGLADHILVTADSVNMATEAASTGKPVHLLDVDRAPFAFGAGKFARLHAALEARGAARWFDGALIPTPYEPLDEAGRAAEEIAARFARWRARAS